jgi:hypothetical protein
VDNKLEGHVPVGYRFLQKPGAPKDTLCGRYDETRCSNTGTKLPIPPRAQDIKGVYKYNLMNLSVPEETVRFLFQVIEGDNIDWYAQYMYPI